MMSFLNKNLISRPVFSEVFELKKESPLLNDGVFIYRITSEKRTSGSPSYLKFKNKINVKILSETDTLVEYLYNRKRSVLNLIDESSVKEFFDNFKSTLYIDITGLLHTTWAIFLKVCFANRIKIKIIYTEPLIYISTKEHVYNLSLKLNPIKPIPGFAVLGSIGTEKFSFVPLLGFEKRRFELMLTNVDPPQYSTYPIIGIPGFQLHFPFETYLSNKKKLLENNLHQNIRFAAASCPFRLYYALYDLTLECRSELYKIAMIGTKPHALGAILFYLCSGQPVELLYDHPKRKEGRSKGIYKLHVYHVDYFREFITRN